MLYQFIIIKEIVMNKLLTALYFAFFALLVSDPANANHCSGGHKEIKDTKDSTSSEENTKEATKTN